MASTGLGLLIEESRTEITASWRAAVERELGAKEPALGFAVAPLLRELALAGSGDGRAGDGPEAWRRCAVLVRSTALPAQVAREFKLLHRSTWEALRARGAPVAAADRRAADEWLDDALAEALERLERVRQRVASFENHGTGALVRAAAPGAAVPDRQGHPPAARSAAAIRPPPLPPRAAIARAPAHPGPDRTRLTAASGAMPAADGSALT